MVKNNLLEIKNLHKSFGQKKVIRNLNFSLSRGEVLGFIGPNGAGKTTTIRLILGLIYPDKGTVKIDGYDIKTDFYKAIARVGAVVETPKFYTYLSGYQNLALIANLYPRVHRSKVREVLDLVGLSSRGGDKVKTYSQGMRQRLGIARALINQPRLVFLDEPMNGLDPQGMLDIKVLINRLAFEHDMTFFITSHLLQEVENVCSQVAVLQEGQLIAHGPVEDLLMKESEVVEISTSRTAEAHALLDGLDYVLSHHAADDKVYVEIEKGSSGQLNSYLVDNRIDILYLVPKKQTLEHYFFNLTGGKENID